MAFKQWPRDVVERFFSHVVPGPNGCLIWTGAVSSDGYGITGTGERTERGNARLKGTHIFSYLIAHNLDVVPRKDGKKQDVMHSCDNKVCVNPLHLRIGSRKDNIRDMCSKGRGKPGTRPGEPRARLTPSQRAEIQRKHKSGFFSLGELAREYKVTHKTIADFLSGKSWKTTL